MLIQMPKLSVKLKHIPRSTSLFYWFTVSSIGLSRFRTLFFLQTSQGNVCLQCCKNSSLFKAYNSEGFTQDFENLESKPTSKPAEFYMIISTPSFILAVQFYIVYLCDNAFNTKCLSRHIHIRKIKST